MSVEKRVTINEPQETPSTTFLNHHNHRHRCCFPNTSLWDHIRISESDNKWWTRPITAFKKIREWSEIVAGPKWKTFIRRFNRNNRGHVTAGKFQYDPLSYALNFDEGQGQNSHFEEDGQGFVENNYPDFSSRFAGNSVDLGKGAPAS